MLPEMVTGGLLRSARATRRFSWATWVAVPTLACALVGTLFFPELVSLWWHARHGNSAELHEWTIPVPWGWYAVFHDDQLIIQRMTPVYSRLDPTTIVVLTLDLRASESVSVESFKNAVVRVMSKHGYIFKGERQIQLGNYPGSCLQFSSTAEVAKIRVSCWSKKGQVSTDLFGYSNDIQTLYSILDKVKQK